MTAHEEKYLECAAAYALGALDGDELWEFEAHLRSGCTVCSAEIASFGETISLLPAALPPKTAPADVRAALLSAIHASAEARRQAGARTSRLLEETSAQPARRSWLNYGLVFAVIVMIIVFSLSYNSLLNTLSEKSTLIGSQQTQITALKDELQRKTEILKVLESRKIEIVTMDGLTVNPVGYGKIIWDPEKKVAVLQVAQLPPVPKNKDYQLWVITKSEPTKPVSAGVFAVENEAEKENYFKVQPLEVVDRNEIGAFAITLEPKGGVPAPTGDMYLLGKTSPK
ncbi:MAG TPA: anti-sigma factor [Bacteroidota bacterium]|jgi:anti-sigma-K factor RskA|nr:anti-sigma factor [Bacteroidota bacterium]